MAPEDVGRERDSLRGQRGEPVGVLLTIPIVEEDGLPLYIAEVAASLLEGKETRRRMRLGGGFQHTDPGDVPLRLRCGGERRRKQAQRECHTEPHSTVPHGHLLEGGLMLTVFFY
jgi:hypothetical protein